MASTFPLEPLADAGTAEVSDYERERGKPMPGLNYAVIQSRLMRGFFTSAPHLAVLPELTLAFAQSAPLTPDLAVLPSVSPDWQHEQVRSRETPLLVVEIFSSSQGYQAIMNKLDGYFAHGVPSAWVVEPALQAIAIYRPGASRPRVFTEGEVRDEPTGLTVRVEEIFA